MIAVSPVLPNSPAIPEIVIAKDQPEYIPLPAAILDYQDGTRLVVTCFDLSDAELAEIQKTGRIWVEQITFRQSLQPQRLTVFEPLTDADVKNAQKT